MKYYGIKTPASDHQHTMIWWISDSAHGAWNSFFTYPNPAGDKNFHRMPMAEAIQAYEAIGYECVELDVVEKTAIDNDEVRRLRRLLGYCAMPSVERPEFLTGLSVKDIVRIALNPISTGGTNGQV